MKIKTCLLLLACLCFAAISFAADIALANDDGGTGVRPRIAAARMAVISPVQADLTDNNEVEINFLADFGNVTVTVTDNSGMVYRIVRINTSVDNHPVIDISMLAPGEYILKIKDEQGTLSKTGKFKVD